MDEPEEGFQKLREAYLAEIDPQSRIESDLVDQLVVARWRLERIWMIETGLLDLDPHGPRLPLPVRRFPHPGTPEPL
jgi:hypothetical protein